MKKSCLAVLFILIASQAVVFAQSNTIVEQVKEAIKTGSAKELAKYLNTSVDVTLDGKPSTYSKAQAEIVLRDFFKANPPNEFNIIHQGSSKGGQPFAIGQYKSQNNTYRVWMKIRVVGNQSFVQEISFVKE